MDNIGKGLEEPFWSLQELMLSLACKISIAKLTGRKLRSRCVILPSSALAPGSAWAELVLVPDNPGRPTDRPADRPADRPSGIVLSRANTAWRSKV